MTPDQVEVLSELGRLAAAMDGLAETAAIAYVRGLPGQGAPIVDDRFKGKGNARFPPLKPATVAKKMARLSKDKAGGLVKRGVFTSPFKGSSSKLLAGQKPILVDSGLLRAATTSGAHSITAAPGEATVVFRGLPDYAEYLHTGTGRMPRRSPVELNAEDRARIVAAMRRALSARVGDAGTVPISKGSVPGRARLA